jgi:hypothetical protein
MSNGILAVGMECIHTILLRSQKLSEEEKLLSSLMRKERD